MRACTGWPAGWGSSVDVAGGASSVHGLPRHCPILVQHASTQAGSRTVHPQRHGQPVSASAVRGWWPWQQGSRGTGVGDVPGGPSSASSLVSEAPTSSSSNLMGGPLGSTGRCGVLEPQLPASHSPSLEGSTQNIDSRPSLAQCLAQLLAVDVPEPSSPSQRLPAVTVRFVVPEFVSSPGQRLVVVGSVPVLGSWDVAQGACMTWHKGHRWTVQVQLDPGWHGALEFKVVLVEHRHTTWEPGSNRLLVVERPRPSMLRSHNSLADLSSTRGPSPEHSSSYSRAASPGSPSSSPARSLDECNGCSNSVPGPVLCVECEWGKAEAPAPALPPSLLCSATTPGRMADGLHVGAALQSAAGEEAAAAAANSGSVIMANCQVVVPLLEQDSAAARLACEDGGGGVQLMLVGNLPALGCWAPALGLPLACDESGMWRARLEVPMGYPVHAKLVLWDSNTSKARMWEPGPNRVIRLPDPPASMLNSHVAATSSLPGALTAGSSAVDSAMGPASASAGRMPFPVMADGEFMLLMHWSVPTFPHLVFLPSLDHPHAAQHQAMKSATRPFARNQQQPSNVLCRFTLPHFPTHPNQHVVLVGGHAKLGDWDPTRGLRLQWGPGHSWQASVYLPADAELEAKVVMWDGTQYKWEEGPNRKLRPGALVKQVAPSGCWGEVLHCMYWGSHALAGKTPAVVVPHDVELAAVGSWGNSTAGSNGASSELTSIIAPAPSAGSGGSPGPASPSSSAGLSGACEPSMALLGLSSMITAAALGLRSDLDVLFGTDTGSPGANGTHMAAAAANKAASQVASLEASLEAARAQVSELTGLRQREVDALRVQLAESAKALAAEEDQVESLHAQLAQRGQELRSLTAQLARAEATAAAAVAAATTALNTSASLGGGLLRSFASSSVDQGQLMTPDLLVSSMQQLQGGGSAGNGSSENNQGMPAVAVATFQKLTEQLAAVQLEADSTRQALAEAQAMRITEAAHLRAELSEAVACRHKESEAARVAAAAMALTHQQEVSSLQAALTDAHAVRQREVTALRVRMDQIVARQEKETARLARQLGQACAAAEALEAQVLAQRSATAALSASGSAELRRLRSLLSVQASELEALRSQLADGHAAQVLGRLGNGNGNGSGHHHVAAVASSNGNGYASLNGHHSSMSTTSSDNTSVITQLAADMSGMLGSNGHGVLSTSTTALPYASGEGLSGPLFERGGSTAQLANMPAAVAVDVQLGDEDNEELDAASVPTNADTLSTVASEQNGAVAAAAKQQSPAQPTDQQADCAGRGSNRSHAVVPATGPLALWIQRLTAKGARAQNGTSHMNNIVPLAGMNGTAHQGVGQSGLDGGLGGDGAKGRPGEQPDSSPSGTQ